MSYLLKRRKRNGTASRHINVTVQDELTSSSSVTQKIVTEKAKSHGKKVSSSTSNYIPFRVKSLFRIAGFDPEHSHEKLSSLLVPPVHEYHRYGLDFEEEIPQPPPPPEPEYQVQGSTFQIVEARHHLDRSSKIDITELLSYLDRVYHLYIGEWGESLQTAWNSMSFKPPVTIELVEKLGETKSKFDELYKVNAAGFRRARNEMNPYEQIGKACFINRAAVKMANIDSAYGFLRPYLRGHPADKNYLLFADLCAAPGGFSEYIIWRTGGRARGYGFSLAHDRDTWRIHDFNTVAYERAENGKHLQILFGNDKYIKSGDRVHFDQIEPKGSGDITNTKNVERFAFIVVNRSRGVDVVVADGGSDVSDWWNLQELLMKQLVLGQIVSMFRILRHGGSFVLKVFDVFSPFTVSLLYLLYISFTRFSIFKPVTSRPGNSERYIVCQGLHFGGSEWQIQNLREDARLSIIEKLTETNNLLEIHRQERTRQQRSRTDVGGIDVRALFDFNKCESEFFTYLSKSAVDHCHHQIGSLEAVYNRMIHGITPPDEHVTIAQSCYELWKIPHSREDHHALQNLQWSLDEAVVPRKKLEKIDLPPAMQRGVDHVAQSMQGLPMDPELAALLD
ncbi:hypothetical protein P9112_007459 [Eukaryota sp. TZLM1-RC]